MAPRGLQNKQRDPPGTHQRDNTVVFIPEEEKQRTTMLCSQDHTLNLECVLSADSGINSLSSEAYF